MKRTVEIMEKLLVGKYERVDEWIGESDVAEVRRVLLDLTLQVRIAKLDDEVTYLKQQVENSLEAQNECEEQLNELDERECK